MGSRRYEGIVTFFLSILGDFRQNLIHDLGDFFGRMARHIFAQGIAKQPAPRLPRAPRQAFHRVEKLMGNEDHCFHPESIMGPARGMQAKS